MVIAGGIVSDQGGYYAPRPCGQLDFIFNGDKNTTLEHFPECAPFYSGDNPGQYAMVEANMDGDSAAYAVAALGIGFGPAIWLAIFIHGVGVEIYVSDDVFSSL